MIWCHSDWTQSIKVPRQNISKPMFHCTKTFEYQIQLWNCFSDDTNAQWRPPHAWLIINIDINKSTHHLYDYRCNISEFPTKTTSWCQYKEFKSGVSHSLYLHQCDIRLFLLLLAEDPVVVSSDYDSTHEANHSDSSDVAHTEEDTEEGKNPAQNVILHSLIPPEVRCDQAHCPQSY